jgi:hypothetical protein
VLDCALTYLLAPCARISMTTPKTNRGRGRLQERRRLVNRLELNNNLCLIGQGSFLAIVPKILKSYSYSDSWESGQIKVSRVLMGPKTRLNRYALTGRVVVRGRFLR